MVWDDHEYCRRCGKHSNTCWCNDDWDDAQCSGYDGQDDVHAFTVHLIYALNDPRAVCNDQIYIPPPMDYVGVVRLCQQCYWKTLRGEPT